MQRHPQNRLYLDLYDWLLADCQAAPSEAKLLKAERLLSLIILTEAFQRGEQPKLNKAIRKEKDLDKVLALNEI